MAAAKDMQIIRKVLLSMQGATGEMLFAGLAPALLDGPEERHELQAGLLKMIRQVLVGAQSTAKLEADETCKRKVDAAEAELAARRAVVASATQVLAVTEATLKAQTEKLASCRQQLASEEEEHQRMEAVDEEKAKEVALQLQGKNEVSGYLESMAQQGDGDAIQQYLRSVGAEPTLVAALRTVLAKDPSERTGFDSVALVHLQGALEKKVAEWEAAVTATGNAKAIIHSEALGAWAIKAVAAEHVKEVEVELAAAEEALALAQQQLKEATEAEQHEENVLAHYLTDLTLAGERVLECTAALEKLGCLELGPADVVQEQKELPLVTIETNEAMDVDMQSCGAKMDAAMDVDMGMPIAA